MDADSLMQITPFVSQDAFELEQTGILSGNYWCNFQENAHLNELAGKGYTARLEGKVIICAGITAYWPGVGEVWGLFSPDVKKFRLASIQNIIIYLNELLDEGEYRYVQSAPRASFPAGISLLQQLGFKRKCTLKKYAPDGGDCFLYVLER